METLEFKPREVKTERTHVITGIVKSCTSYENSTGLKGVILEVEGVPYSLRLLTKKDTKQFLLSKVKLTGVVREYNNAEYFNPMDIEVLELSTLAKLAMSGVAFAGTI